MALGIVSCSANRCGRVFVAVCVVAYLVMGFSWLERDSLPRDGDEEGHVGAAELIVQVADRSSMEGLAMAFAGDLGDYPPLYPGVVGLYWSAAGGGDPARTAVRGINLIWPLLAALAVWAVLRPRGVLGAGLGAGLLLWSPGVVGISRHFMPEGMLVAGVAGAFWAIWWLPQARSRAAPVLVGGLLASAFLIKQTAVLFLIGPLWVGLPRDRKGLQALVCAALLIAPWAIPHGAEQWAYGAASAVGASGVSLFEHLAFYPLSVALGVLGPGLVLMLLPDRAGEPSHDERARRMAWVGLMVAMLLLVLLPKKYPRLLLPLVPLACVLIGQHWQGLARRWVWVGLGAIAVGWTVGLSEGLYTLPRSAEVIDARCPQTWIRGPVADDWGLGAVVQIARTAPAGPIFVRDAPEIPCSLQSTFPWDQHLGPALRRGGSDREQTLDAERAAIRVEWGDQADAPPADSVFVPTLGRWFRVIVP